MWIFQEGTVVGIGIRAVAATIDVAPDAGIDTHGIAAEDLARDVVTAIDVVDIAVANQYAHREAFRETVAREVLNFSNQFPIGI